MNRIDAGVLRTDMYQLTMAQLYYRKGLHEKQAQFDHFFRSYPDYGGHQAGYCVNAGLHWLLRWMRDARFDAEQLEFLGSQTGRAGTPLFDRGFLRWLQEASGFDGLSLRAVPEGRVVHPNVPLTVVTGPLGAAQILETSLLNQLNYQILIATKAARVREAGRGNLVLEFGLRRGQDLGASAGARAALIGGADFTSNVGISAALGLPPKGTHAHSMVQAFMALGEGELGAFRAYAEVYPDDCLLLVDTVNTLESGVPNAIRVFEELRKKGHEPVGIRLDSGDLAHLSIRAARMLNDAGFPDTAIVLSNQLDEMVLLQIINQITDEAPAAGLDPDGVIGRLLYGVGTKLITSAGQAALDGVYKLVGIYDGSRWQPAIKLSETPAKVPNPGDKAVWRVYDGQGKATADLIARAEEDVAAMDPLRLQHPIEGTVQRRLARADIGRIEPLLQEVVREGTVTAEEPSIEAMRAAREKDVGSLHKGVRRIVNPHRYHVSLTPALWKLKQELITSVR